MAQLIITKGHEKEKFSLINYIGTEIGYAIETALGFVGDKILVNGEHTKKLTRELQSSDTIEIIMEEPCQITC